MHNFETKMNKILYMVENLNQSYSPYVADLSDF